MTTVNTATSVNRQAITKLYQQQKAAFNKALNAANPTTSVSGNVAVKDRVDFSKLVNNAITNPGNIVDKLQIAEQAAIDHTHGKIDPVQLATRIDEATTALNTIVKIRDHIVDAIKKIYDTPI